MEKGLTKFQIFFMAITCTLVVGNVYYNQPLLGVLARHFNVSDAEIGLVPTLTLIGYAFGIVFLVPLGDMVERRKLLQASMIVSGLLCIGISYSPTLLVLNILSMAMGFFNVSASVIIPFAANLAKPEERGKVTGIVLSGILLGSLMARTLAGFIGQYMGWSGVFLIAGSINIVLAFVTQIVLPYSEPHFQGSYKGLLLSLGELIRDLPIAREASLMGGILFASFSAFWTTLTFLLEGAPFHYSPQTIGLFGALGMIGALAAPLAGKYADKKGTAATIRLGLYCSMLAFALLAVSSVHAIGIIFGVLILDLGIQVAHISNQSRIFELNPNARSRLNTIYIFSYFTGGSLGSYAGTLLWSWGKWPAVSVGGLILCAFAALIFRRGRKIRANLEFKPV